MRMRGERADYVRKKLASCYPETPIPLDHKDTYTLLIAVLLSAQCTDVRVNKVTPHLFVKADTPQQMVKLSVDQIRQIIRPCGLSPRKAKSIHRLSEMLISEYGGEVPSSFEALEAFPGVGHKTASVVMSQAFGCPAFPVDTHIHRLAQRWGLTRGRNVVRTEKDLKAVFPQKEWNQLHLRIVFYGREYCTARGCDGRTCEICKVCYPHRKKPFVHYRA